jgi:histidine ammonia-lyase
MTTDILTDLPLTWQDIAAVAKGASLDLSAAARQRIIDARLIVEAIVERGIRGYGINTGVGALCETVIGRQDQQALSHNIVMSHACGVGDPLGRTETRAIIAAQINNYAHGASGVRLEIVDALRRLLDTDCIPTVPSRGSVGYLTHMASIALVLTGHGSAIHQGDLLPGREALHRIGFEPLRLQAKEGLSLINGTPCATGLACVALARLQILMDWADAAAAMSYDNLGSQTTAFAEASLALRQSPGLQSVGRTLRDYLEDSTLLAHSAGARTQDALSLRAVPQIHGAVRDVFDATAVVVDRELASVTDNPAVGGTPDNPLVYSQAHAIGAALGLAMDSLAVAAAELAAISERRIDRLVNPLVSGLPAFLAEGSGVFSGYMIAQYTAAALVAENRRLAAPASLDGGITSALQEDILTHATPAATKLLAILDNLEQILAIELLAAAQAYELQPKTPAPAPRLASIYKMIRAAIPAYADDRPMNDDFSLMRQLMQRAPRPGPVQPIETA